MTASIDNIAQINSINAAFMVSTESYFTIKMHYIENLSVKYTEMTDEAMQAAWFQTLPAEKTLRAILATQIKTYRIYFITQSKKTGHKMIEINVKNDELSQEHRTMKNSIIQLLRELALIATSISTDEKDFLVTISELDVNDCEDIAGALGALAAGYLSQSGRNHFLELRK